MGTIKETFPLQKARFMSQLNLNLYSFFDVTAE